MNCALTCICHYHETCPRPDRGMGTYLIFFYSSGFCGHDASCPYIAILFIFWVVNYSIQYNIKISKFAIKPNFLRQIIYYEIYN
jgi:hypothetical protein